MKSFAEPRFGTMTLVGVLSLSVGLIAPGSAQAGPVPAPAQADQSAAAKGVAALTAARQAAAAGDWNLAANKYAEALTYLPGNQEALDGQHNALTQLNQGNTSADIQRQREQLRQKAKVEFDDSYNRAKERLGQGDYPAARDEINLAKSMLLGRSEYLDASEYTAMLKKADDLQNDIREREIAAQAAQDEQARKDALAKKEEQDRKDKAARQNKIDEALKRVRQLQMELKYKEALQVLDEILFIDELNPAAQALRAVIQDAMVYRMYSQIQQSKNLGYTEQTIRNQGAMVLPRKNLSGPGAKSLSGVMEYPEDWPQLSNLRGRGVGGFQESPVDRSVRQKIEETQIPVDFTNNTVEQVIGFLEQVTGLSIYPDWKALNNAGINKEDQVSLKLQDANVATVLARVLEQLGDGKQAQYTIQDGILTISSDEAIRKHTLLLVYDIRDLLFQVPTFDNAPQVDLDSALNQGQGQGGGGGSGGGGGGGGFGGGGGGGGGSGGGGGGSGGSIFNGSGEDPPRLTRAELVKQIVDIIQENVDPEGWRDLGGDTGSLQELNGNLIITNTPNNHRSIEGLLAQLREIRALQINVESRFLTVSNDWFEKIGVDLDLYFNTGNPMVDAAKAVDPNSHLSDFFGVNGKLQDPLVYGSPAQILANPAQFNAFPSGAYQGVPGAPVPGGFQAQDYVTGPFGAPIRNQHGFAPIGVKQNSATLIDQLADFDALSFAGIASANPALAVGIQFLDDIQVDLMIEATQADKRSVVLTAPRLTFFNGQRAWVAVTTQRAFISSLTAVTGDSSGAFQPNVGRISDGFVLDVEGVISSDRRYVTMTVLFDFAEFLGFRESDAAEVSGGAGGGGTTGGTATQFTGQVELPELRVSQVRTTVSVPDKGTILLGGQRRVQEIEVESGVPVLSKIPFINRFFTNRVTSKDEQTLLILIRPEIVIQQENEDLLFPGLSDSLGSAGSYLR